jgi:hypothetical protein
MELAADRTVPVDPEVGLAVLAFMWRGVLQFKGSM